VPPLGEIRARIERDAKRAAGAIKAKERAATLLASARELGLAAAAKAAALETTVTGLFARRAGSIPTLGAASELRETAFGLATDAPLAPNVYTVSGDAVVAALDERKDAVMTGFEQEKTALEESLLERKRRAAYERYLEGLKKQASDHGALLVQANALGRS
jgi:hypothetical protein